MGRRMPSPLFSLDGHPTISMPDKEALVLPDVFAASRVGYIVVPTPLDHPVVLLPNLVTRSRISISRLLLFLHDAKKARSPQLC